VGSKEESTGSLAAAKPTEEVVLVVLCDCLLWKDGYSKDGFV